MLLVSAAELESRCRASARLGAGGSRPPNDRPTRSTPQLATVGDHARTLALGALAFRPS